jgi:outer membrane protein W
MKNCIILLLALTLSLSTVFAQENVSIGPIAGVSLANFHGDIDNTNTKPGLTIGAFYNYSSKKGYGFSGQVLYTQLGAQTDNKTNEINLNYVQVPLLFTFFFGEFGDRLRPKVFIGPSLNFMVSANDKNGNNINGTSNNRIYNVFDLGLTGGLGFNYELTQKVWLNFDVRYGLGLLDVTKDPNRSIQNRNFGINLGLSFPLGTYDKKSGRLRTR